MKYILVIIALAVSLLLSEMILRVADVGGYSLRYRVLFYSFPAFDMDDHDAVRYKPDTDIRNIAVYGDQIDYDTKRRTNNLGFLDTHDYISSSHDGRDIVFVGDSYTAGSGGTTSWVELLRDINIDNQADSRYYNLGVAGTGIHHFSRLLESFNTDINFDEIYIMLITSDLFRGFWYPLEGINHIWFCREHYDPATCKKRSRPVINRIRLSATTDSVIEKANVIYKRNILAPNRDADIFRSSRLYELFCNAYGMVRPTSNNQFICPHLKIYKYKSLIKDDHYKDSIAGLKSIGDKFRGKKIQVIHIPEKGEVYSGEYSLDISDDIISSGMGYVSLLDICDFKSSMFHKHDAHPNDDGYIHIAECINSILTDQME